MELETPMRLAVHKAVVGHRALKYEMIMRYRG